MGIWEKYEQGFVERLGGLKKETPSKNRSKGSKMRGKSKLFEFGIEFPKMEDLAI
jgi:hypothetical protein